jgi:hypothetical protein
MPSPSHLRGGDRLRKGVDAEAVSVALIVESGARRGWNWQPGMSVLAIAAIVLLVGTSAPTSSDTSIFGVDQTIAPEPASTTVDDGDRPRLTNEEMTSLVDSQRGKSRYDGTVLGWRVGSYEALAAAELAEQGVSRSCDQVEVGAETATELDFVATYFPVDFKVELIEGPVKWVCGNEALSVRYVYQVLSHLGYGEIWFERSLRGSPVLEMNVPVDSIEAAEVRGVPAIIFHPIDDASGFGQGRVVVLEESRGAEFQILSVTADNGVPTHELVRIVEGVK